MTPQIEFDNWMRTSFVEMNTALEDIYFAQENRVSVGGGGGIIRQQLATEGGALVARIPGGQAGCDAFEPAFDVLGNVGMYMAACMRHGMTESSQSILVEASSLALRIAAGLGVAPRFSASHLTTHNRAVDGCYKTFTAIKDEKTFLNFNTLGILGYKRATDSLARILPMGISHPAAYELLAAAESALHEVLKLNSALFDELDVDRFFYCVRPYYKPFRVGPRVYRGANAGDFSGINEIDMLLGLCGVNAGPYVDILIDKLPYLVPEDQVRLRACIRQPTNLLQSFLDAIQASGRTNWFQKHCRKFLDVVAVYGQAAAQHHDQLVRRFIEGPASTLPAKDLESITASGPPLGVLIRSLKDLKDLRIAADREDIPSRHRDLEKLAGTLCRQRGP